MKKILVVLAMTIVGLLGISEPAEASRPCVSVKQVKKIDLGDTKKMTYRRIGKGRREMLFVWQMHNYPVAYSDFRVWKMCNGKKLRLTFASPYGDQTQWTIEDKEILR